jgi:hypothetical protein
MSYNGKHPAQIAQEIEPMLSWVFQRSQLRVLSVSLNLAGDTATLAYRHGIGRLPESEQPLFPIGCVMDTIFSIIGVHLHHHAGLRLDMPVRELLPDVFSEGEPDPGPPITFQHLLTRTSGIQDPRTLEEMRGWVAWPELSPRIRESPRLFTPGTAFNYGGIDRTLLAAALMKFTGKGFDRLGDEIINGPCGIELRPEQYATGADGVRRLTLTDTKAMAQVSACLALGSLGEDAPGFSDAVRTYLQVEKFPISRSIRSPPWPHAAEAFTLGYFKYSDGLIGYNGFDQGASCSVRFDAQGGIAYSVALEGPPKVRDYILAEIAQKLGYNCAQSRAAPCTVGSLNGLQAADIAGEYVGWAHGFRAHVSLTDEGVAAELTYRDGCFRRLRLRLEEGSWLVAETAAELSSLEFYRDKHTGRVCMASGGVPYAMTNTRLNA